MLLNWRAAVRYPSVNQLKAEMEEETGQAVVPADLPGMYDWCQNEWSDRTSRLVELTMDRLRQLVRLAQDHEVNIVITAVPRLEHFQGWYSLKPFETIQRVCHEEDVPYLDSLNGLKQLLGDDDPATLYINGDKHLNEHGYTRWAQVQTRFITDPANGLLPAGMSESTPDN